MSFSIHLIQYKLESVYLFKEFFYYYFYSHFCFSARLFHCISQTFFSRREWKWAAKFWILFSVLCLYYFYKRPCNFSLFILLQDVLVDFTTNGHLPHFFLMYTGFYIMSSWACSFSTINELFCKVPTEFTYERTMVFMNCISANQQFWYCNTRNSSI